MVTDPNYSPHSLLPAPEPCTVSPPADYFYEHVAKHLVRDTVRIMHNGLPIDLNRVIELEDTLDTLLADVAARIAANPYIQQYMQQRHAALIQDYIKERTSRLRPVDSFITPFVYNNAEHRSYFMHIYAEQQQITPPSELLPSGIPKWDVRLIKKLSTSRPLLQRLLAGQLQIDHPIVLQAMQLRAQHKADTYNRKFLAQIESPEVELPPFNVGSSTQKKQLFSMLGYESEVKSKGTGEDSWNRNQIERLLKETDDPCLKDLLTAMIDYSYGAIIKQNFVPAFYKYTVNGRLHGQYKLFGAKSFRYTSANPNMLNAPSTASIYAKPVKRCFVAPPGYIFYAIDLSALEDRVMASLSRDTNKCNIFLQDLDGHCLNAYGYFLDEIAQYMPITGDTVTDVKLFFKLQDEGHKELKAIRQKGKPAKQSGRYKDIELLENPKA